MRKVPFLLVIGLMTGCGNETKTVTPEIKPLVEAIYATGYVVAKGEYQVFAQTEGYLVSKLAQEGSTVKAGDPLFIIESDQQAARHRIALENYQIAKKNAHPDSPASRELKAALEASRNKMRYDSANYMRFDNLWKQNATTHADYDRARLAYDNSRSDYQLQKSRYDKMQDQFQLELANAESQLKIATDESSRFTIRSLVDGMVFSTTKEQGELVRRGEVLAVVGKKDGFYLQLSVDELDIQRVAPEQRVLVSIDAYPGKVYEASVTQVYPLIDKRQQSIRVDATLKEELPGWFSGLALEANIIIREKKDALVIPKGALLPGDSVVVVRDGKEKTIPVTPGIETLDEVEIVEGLDSTSHLIVAL